MSKKKTTKSSAAAGILFVLCGAAAAAGFLFDNSMYDAPAFWIGAQPGGALALGAGAAAFCAAAGYLAHGLRSRWVVKGGRRVRPDA